MELRTIALSQTLSYILVLVCSTGRDFISASLLRTHARKTQRFSDGLEVWWALLWNNFVCLILVSTNTNLIDPSSVIHFRTFRSRI